MTRPVRADEEAEPTMTTEQRLEKLERELSRATRCNSWLLAALAVFLGVWVIGESFGPETARAQPAAAAFKEIRANRIVVEDKKGKVRVDLSVDKDGPALTLSDDKGNTGVWLNLGKNGPALRLNDDKVNTGVWLNLDKDGPALRLTDDKGNSRVSLNVRKDGTSLALYDEKGQPRAKLGAGSTSSPDGTKTTYPESSLRLFGPKGKMLWSAPR